MQLRQKKRVFDRAREGQKTVPIKSHVSRMVCLTNKDALVSVIELVGISYEDKTLDQLDAYKSLLNNTYKNIHHPRLGIWNCLLRRQCPVIVNTDLDCEFSRQLAEKYQTKLTGLTRQNNHYIALVYHPFSRANSFAVNKKKDKGAFVEIIEDGVEFLESKTREVASALSAYQPRILGIDETTQCSEIGAFYSSLLYFDPQPVPVRAENIANAVFNRRLLFGNETIEIRHQTRSDYAAVLGIKEYAESTSPDMFVQLNSLPFDFNLVQSFTCMERPKAKDLMERQRNVLVSSGDVARSQIEAIEDALDDLISGRFTLGDHNASLIVRGTSSEDLKDNVYVALTAFQEPGLVVVREDVANEAHYLSQLPGNATYRPRPSPLTSLNFASMAPMFGEPRGREFGNHWGKAVIPFLTTTGGIYHHNNHHDDVGSLGIYGMTGAGKTVVMNTLESMLRRDGIRHVNFDKDEGSKVLIYALGGEYYSLQTGQSTGINPFHALEPTEKNIYYLVDLVQLLVGEADAGQREMIERGIKSVYGLQRENQRLSALVTFLDRSDPTGIAARLMEWTGSNRNGWVFDNERNTLNLTDVTGFDVTDLLENNHVRTPVVSYLMFRIMELIDGNPICIWMDEFWKLLEHEYFRDTFLRNQYKTIRKNNGCLILATQSPSDAINSEIGKTIIEQTPTTIFLPNERADQGDYINGFRMTAAEWEGFSVLTKESRRFLVKQGETSVMATLPLHGMEDELNVLSGRKAFNKLFDGLYQDGKLPDNWLVLYQQATRRGEIK